jgi:glycosyltransferase involved in cell wall biosynthesis
LREEYEKFPEALTSYQQHLFKVIAPINARKDQQYDNADLIVTNSEFSRRTFIEAGIPAYKVVAVPTGCPPVKQGLAKKAHDNSSTMVFLNAGNQSVQKGTSYLLEAWKSLNRTNKAELWMVGNLGLPSSQFGSLPQNIQLLPRVPRNELGRLFDQASVLVLPTLCEGRAHIILEAIAAGLAIITTENSGCGDLVENGVNGWKVPIRDADALANRISWCLERPEEVEKMKRQSLLKAESWQVRDFISEHSELIKSFLRSSGWVGEASCAA